MLADVTTNATRHRLQEEVLSNDNTGTATQLTATVQQGETSMPQICHSWHTGTVNIVMIIFMADNDYYGGACMIRSQNV